MATKIIDDPTREGMLAFITIGNACDEVDAECAIYWFAHDYHGGLSTNLYEVLSTSPYHPGPLERGPTGHARIAYELLEEQFTTVITKPKE